MTMFKKNGGFTLVELIVVIAILAILAGVAVPAYSGYITKAKDTAVIVELDAIATAAQASKATTGAVNAIAVGSDGAITVDEAEPNADFKAYYGDAFKGSLEGTSYASGANWTRADGWKPAS